MSGKQKFTLEVTDDAGDTRLVTVYAMDKAQAWMRARMLVKKMFKIEDHRGVGNRMISRL